MAGAHHRLAGTVWIAAALLGVAPGASAEKSAGTYHLLSRAGYSDNIKLAPAGFEDGQRVAEISAGVDFAHTQERQDTHISYLAQGVFYGESNDSDEVFNTLNATSQWALVSNRVFLDLYGVYDQTIVDPTGSYSFNKLALTGNRTDVAIVGASPSVALGIGENVEGEIRFTDTLINYADPEVEDSNEQVLSFVLGNYGSTRGGTWAVTYDQEEFDYELSPLVHFEIFDVELGAWVTPTVRLFTNQGLESDYTLVGQPGAGSPGLDDHYWYAGVDWRPNDRHEVVVSSGERSFGEAHRVNWSYRSARGGIVVGYAEEPSTFLREQLHSVRRTGELAPIDSLDGPEGDLFYLQKRSDVTFLLERQRSSVALRFFEERRFDIVEATADVTEDTEEYSGKELNLRWEVNSKATLDVTARSARRRSTLNSIDDELKGIIVSLDRRVGRQGTLSFDVSHERASPKSGSGENAYTENEVIVGIQRWFGSVPTARAPQRFSGYLNDAPY